MYQHFYFLFKMVDESEDRFSEDDVENLLKVVADCEIIPPQETTNEEEDVEEN